MGLDIDGIIDLKAHFFNSTRLFCKMDSSFNKTELENDTFFLLYTFIDSIY